MHVNGLQSQTLKVHPVASKTLTQKRPVYAAPESLVGDFSFSIVFFLGTVTCPYPNGPICEAVMLRPWIGQNEPIHGLPHTHNLFSAAAPPISPP